jgi:hypothetical protein
MTKESSTSSKKKSKAEKDIKTEQTTLTSPATKKSYSSGQLFWGGLLIVIGSLFLLGNFGVIDPRFEDIIKLWPLLIIAAGLSILSVRSMLWRTISVIAVIASLVFIALVGAGGIKPSQQDAQEQSVRISAQQDVSGADVRLRAGAGTITIGAGEASDVLADATLTSDAMRLEQQESQQDGRQTVDISVVSDRTFWFIGSKPTNLDVLLTRDIPLNLDLDVGAAQLRFDASNLMLEQLYFKAGASAAQLRFGDKADRLRAVIDVGASNIRIELPRGVGVEVTSESGLSNRSLRDFEEVSTGVYQTKDFDRAEKKIRIEAKLGVANLEVIRY